MVASDRKPGLNCIQHGPGLLGLCWGGQLLSCGAHLHPVPVEEPWVPEGRLQGPGTGRGGGMPAESLSSPLCWYHHPGLKASAFPRVLGPREALFSLRLPTLPSGVSTSYLQSLAHILLPQKSFPDSSGSCHGSNNSTSIYMCVMSSVDKSQAT